MHVVISARRLNYSRRRKLASMFHYCYCRHITLPVLMNIWEGNQSDIYEKRSCLTQTHFILAVAKFEQTLSKRIKSLSPEDHFHNSFNTQIILSCLQYNKSWILLYSLTSLMKPFSYSIDETVCKLWNSLQWISNNLRHYSFASYFFPILRQTIRQWKRKGFFSILCIFILVPTRDLQLMFDSNSSPNTIQNKTS